MTVSRPLNFASDLVPHVMLVAAMATVVSFGVSDRVVPSNRWFWWACRGIGAAAAIEAYKEYRRRRPQDVEILNNEHRSELQATFQLQLNQIESGYKRRIGELEGALAAAKFDLQQEQRRLSAGHLTNQQWLEQQANHFEARQLQLEEEHAAKLQALNNQLEQKKAQLVQLLQETMENERQAAAYEVQRLKSDVLIRDQIIAELQTDLSRAQQIKWAAGTTRVEFIANQIIEVLLTEEIIADYSDSTSYDGKDVIWVNPRAIVKREKLQTVCNLIQDQIDGVVKIDAKLKAGAIEFTIESQAERVTQREIEALTLDGFDYFKKAVGKSNHDLVTGGTGSGKSVLVANLIDAASTDLVQEIIKNRQDWNVEIVPDVEIYISDPKFPNTEWYVNGRRVKPQYRGFDVWVDPDGVEHPSALDGYAVMDTEVRLRLDRAMTADHYGKKAIEKPVIFVLDEAEQLVSEESKAASEPILFTTRVGRSQMVRAIVIGQNCNCSAYGLQRPHLQNFTRWFLGDTIEKGIDECCTTTVQKRKYRQELQRLQQIATTNPEKRFFALIKFPNERPVFVYLPPPGYFASQSFVEAGLEHAIELPELKLSTEDLAFQGKTLEQLKDLAAGFNNLSDDERSRLEQIWQKAEEPLPEHLQIIVDYALSLSGAWVTVGKLRSNRARFKRKEDYSEQQILEFFEDLTLKYGIGALSPDGRMYRYEDH